MGLVICFALLAIIECAGFLKFCHPLHRETLSILLLDPPFHLTITLPIQYIAYYYIKGLDTQTSVKHHLPEEAHRFGWSGFLFRVLNSGCLASVDCWIISRILEAGFL